MSEVGENGVLGWLTGGRLLCAQSGTWRIWEADVPERMSGGMNFHYTVSTMRRFRIGAVNAERRVF